jgi:HK97 family phage portal protein
LHIKNFHPINNIYGLSPFEAAADVIDQHNSAIQWNKNLMKNSARPSGALVVNPTKNDSGMLTPDQRDALRDEINCAFASSLNSGRPMILEGGLEWKELSISPKDLDFANADKIAVRQIANAFGVPIQLLNEIDGSSYNNYLEGKRALYENTVLPLLNKIVSSVFNNWLCPTFGKNLQVVYKEEEIPALSYKYEQQLKNLHESNFLTINEKRRSLGLDPIDGGDKLG